MKSQNSQICVVFYQANKSSGASVRLQAAKRLLGATPKRQAALRAAGKEQLQSAPGSTKRGRQRAAGRGGGGPRPGQPTGEGARRRGLPLTPVACICVCVCAAVCASQLAPPPFSSSPPPPLQPASPGCPPLSLEQQQQQPWSFTASPRLAVREYSSGEQNGHGREPEQPVLRHGQLPPRPLVTAPGRSAAFLSPLGPV